MTFLLNENEWGTVYPFCFLRTAELKKKFKNGQVLTLLFVAIIDIYFKLFSA